MQLSVTYQILETLLEALWWQLKLFIHFFHRLSRRLEAWDWVTSTFRLFLRPWRLLNIHLDIVNVMSWNATEGPQFVNDLGVTASFLGWWNHSVLVWTWIFIATLEFLLREAASCYPKHLYYHQKELVWKLIISC